MFDTLNAVDGHKDATPYLYGHGQGYHHTVGEDRNHVTLVQCFTLVFAVGLCLKLVEVFEE